jgi:plasmid stabilization system protein ParE
MTRSIHRLAVDDLEQAVMFYKREAGAGVASRFLNEFERVAHLLERLPELGTPTQAVRRSFPLVNFPYTVIYRPDGHGIRILVVHHHSRDPSHGEGRQ